MNHHYIFMQTLFEDKILVELFKNGIKCWGLQKEGNDFYVSLYPATLDLREGCLRLAFKYNEIDIFNLTFTVVPGRLLNICENSVICISRVQYTRIQYTNISKATKLLGYITPMSIVLHALEGVSKAFNVRSLVGISTKQHVDFVRIKNDKLFDKNYNSLWKKMQAREMGNGNFYIPCPFEKKPLELIKRKYRQKTLNKRNNLVEISNTSYQRINGVLAKENKGISSGNPKSEAIGAYP